jgi:hypothetical protein
VTKASQGRKNVCIEGKFVDFRRLSSFLNTGNLAGKDHGAAGDDTIRPALCTMDRQAMDVGGLKQQAPPAFLG